MQMPLSATERELIQNYRTANEHDRQSISYFAQKAATVAERLKHREGVK